MSLEVQTSPEKLTTPETDEYVPPAPSQEALHRIDELREDVSDTRPTVDPLAPEVVSLPDCDLSRDISEKINALPAAQNSLNQPTTLLGRLWSRVTSLFSTKSNHIGYPEFRCDPSLVLRTSSDDRQTIVRYLRQRESSSDDRQQRLILSYIRSQIEMPNIDRSQAISELGLSVGQIVSFASADNQTDRMIDLGLGNEHAGVISSLNPPRIIHLSGGSVREEPLDVALGSGAYCLTTHPIHGYDPDKLVSSMKKAQSRGTTFDTVEAIADNVTSVHTGSFFSRLLSWFGHATPESTTCSQLIATGLSEAGYGSKPDAPNATYFASLLGVDKNIVVSS